MPVITAAHASSAIQWGDFPTWALAVIALLALIAAVAAYSKQADAARKLAEQVDLQRQQLEDQRQVNARQIRVMDLQLTELQQRTEAVERQQADAITLTGSRWSGKVPELREGKGEPVYMAKVANEWHRPISNVACRIQLSPGDPMHEACLTGELTTFPTGPQMVVETAEEAKKDLVRPGGGAVFVFMYEVGVYPDAMMTLRFTDDAGLYWQIDHNDHLKKLDNRDDW